MPGWSDSFYPSSDRQGVQVVKDKFLENLGPAPIRSMASLMKRAAKALEKAFPGYKFRVTTTGVDGSLVYAAQRWSILTGRALVLRTQILSRVRPAEHPLERRAGYKRLEPPVYNLGLYPGGFAVTPVGEIEKPSKITMRDVNAMLNRYGMANLLADLGGPMVGRVTGAPTIPGVKEFIRRKYNWFDLDDETPTSLHYSTRENGSVYDEEPGEEDIHAARTIEKALKSEYGAKALEILIGTADEWTNLSIHLPGTRRWGSLRARTIRLAYDNPGPMRDALLPLLV